MPAELKAPTVPAPELPEPLFAGRLAQMPKAEPF